MNLHSCTNTGTVLRRRQRFLAAMAAASAALVLGACSATATGTGSGELLQAGKASAPAQVSWTSDNGGLGGTMAVTLPDATYKGRFFEITSQTRADSLSPLWDGWKTAWADWPYWSNQPNGPHAVSAFVVRYSGKAVANLSAPDGSRMRCRFHLTRPASGMAGGGEGECQMAAACHEIVQVRF